jgi:preprotein translocase subunit SecD
MRDRYARIALIIILIGLGIWINFPNVPALKIGDFERSLDVVLGLDLQGGLQVMLEVPEGFEATAQDLEVARQILENRSNGLGVSEVIFQVAGSRRILGEFPGLTDTSEVIDVLKTTGQLEFVDLGDYPLNIGTIVQTDSGGAPTTTEPADGTEETPAAETDTEEPTIYHTVITGDQLKNITVQTNAVGSYYVAFELEDEGAQTFGEFTSNNIGKYLAIVLDKKVISSPSINSAITTGEVMIEGSFTNETANALAVQLRYGSLPIPLEEVETRVIGPTLGEDSLNKSLIAGAIGFGIIALFMLIYYRLPGAMAVLAILVYGLITLTIYKLIPVTLTLPGIAGFLLSTGGALDANILMFERLKEELRSGRKIGQALELAWRRAWPSIRDSNIATIITSIVLFIFGSAYGASTVKGFALTLGLGVVISLFSASVVTRTFLTELLNALNITNFKRWFGI